MGLRFADQVTPALPLAFFAVMSIGAFVQVNSIPHVHEDHWYGHDRPNDKRYVTAHPYEHGRFEHFGPSHRYPVDRFALGAHRFWFPGGFSFAIASWDWDLTSGWCWDCPGDNFVVYDDPDHPVWYLA